MLTLNDFAELSAGRPRRPHVGVPPAHALARPRKPLVHGERARVRVDPNRRLAVVVVVVEGAFLPAARRTSARAWGGGERLGRKGAQRTRGSDWVEREHNGREEVIGSRASTTDAMEAHASSTHPRTHARARRYLCQKSTASRASGVGSHSSSERLKRDTSRNGFTIPWRSGTASWFM